MAITITKKYIKFLQTVNGKTTSTHYMTKETTPNDDSILSIPLDKLFELYGNLILSGFSVSEAIEIVGKVAANAGRTD